MKTLDMKVIIMIWMGLVKASIKNLKQFKEKSILIGFIVELPSCLKCNLSCKAMQLL